MITVLIVALVLQFIVICGLLARLAASQKLLRKELTKPINRTGGLHL